MDKEKKLDFKQIHVLYEHDETEQIQYQWGTALKLKLSII